MQGGAGIQTGMVPNTFELIFKNIAELQRRKWSYTTIKLAVELEDYMILAHGNRTTAITDFNKHSSRSHAVIKIHLGGTLENLVYKGSLNSVDPAGSENAKQSVAGEKLTETKNIKKCLATLNDVTNCYKFCSEGSGGLTLQKTLILPLKSWMIL
ncbi:unnamed protein product [Ceutorhynchus assimilis]|uniref:Kinesin motor domain-containing protein n=1 Tax=Ceutorhynchus assimilis TaxID=467358 RepID=A0A9N9MIJ1_9CUCU|nr:unnamed protein product [Ceutorhynchus assimilis]